jgi:hypothetical protein
MLNGKPQTKTKTKNKIMKNVNRFCSTLLFSMIVALIPMAFGVNPMVAIVLSYIGVEIVSLVAPIGVIGADVYSDTVLLAARAFIKDQNNKKFQLRPEYTRIVDTFMKDREYTIPSLSNLRSATTRATDAMYLKTKDFTVGSSKACTVVGEQSGSGKVTLSWATKTVKIATSFKQHAGNEVAQAMALANDLYNAEKSLFFGASGLDAALLAYLDTNKSGVNAGGSGSFDATNDIMAIATANVDDFYNLVTADMQMNNYNPMFNDIHNTMWTAKQRRYVNQGGGNSTNLAFQFAGFDFHASNLIVPATIGSNAYSSVHYVVPDGGVALLDWNDPLNRAGAAIGDKEWSTYQSILMPGLTLDLFKLKACADTSADGGGTQDLTENWELSLNYALAKQPTATGTPIFKYGTLETTFVS